MLATLYPWIKAIHIMAVIAWMAGLFYLPRLFVHHAERAKPGSELSETFKMMERKLLRIIMNPAMIVTWIMGILLLMTGIVDFGSEYWIHAKLLLVLAMTVFHMWLAKCRKAFETDTNAYSGRTYRLMNEVPTLLMIVIVVLVVVKPF
ncbi:protoporphyrinogen oxidase HemJ [Algicella marina]|uniref:Protoporphyrinogen IX oxidase n=1 Tax=Algicella marina TaxID=2683284 RepID=A0A6P1T1I2_9RHOB|nr:protoporphyrinogen oxidase HemJ [Algicella marina]QHQ36598.1 protoporphyrinogen oxidase HemJ [Algicella marina]